MVERLHRQLKASIMARSTNADWMRELPVALLGIHTAWRAELECSPVELTYGQALRLPGEMVGDSSSVQPTSSFVRDLKSKMEALVPTQTVHHSQPSSHVPAALSDTTSVFVRVDAHRAPLVRPYSGPFRVLERHPKYFVLEMAGKHDSVSIDRLKPAFFADREEPQADKTENSETLEHTVPSHEQTVMSPTVQQYNASDTHAKREKNRK